ncbi:hypothetical protein BTA51_24370 [Hahella sp. CCB-MM4]|uniref:helix-turn-helix domain-containing protein n=1 Tax=Hahella sp. (strain CCB-MM4) TaxID=1926491 RepID=UPI000BD0BD90|nr:helix-turn-helix domain-containing protein [Hahella sp. CCB-MM4]OZG70725.1 hypothetical protein BTA51_24370 [Hahella sp. CCB-MM4]
MNTECEKDVQPGRIIYPGKLLSPYVNYYLMLTGNYEQSEVVDFYPDGGVGVIINLEGNILLNKKLLGKGVFFDGANSKKVQLELKGKVSLIGIRFKPGTFSLFFDADLSKFHNTFHNLYAIGYMLPKRFFEFLESCITDKQRIIAIETWLAYNLSEPDHNISVVLAALKSISANQYDIELQSLVEEIGVDIRQLQRLFKKQMGMSPKKLVKLLRADVARKMLTNSQTLSCLEITYRCGYYDQAHFNREFKNIYGVTPNRYRRIYTD